MNKTTSHIPSSKAPTTVNGFSRQVLDETFGKKFSSQGFNKTGSRTGKVAASSPAVQSKLVKVNEDGSIDMNSTAVEQGLVVVDEDGDVIKDESLLCQKQIVFTPTGKVSTTSPAVQSGLLRLNTDGTVKRGCRAVLKGWVKVSDDGQIITKESALCQRLHLKETDGAHIHGFEVADTITQLFGLSYTKEVALRMVLAINHDTNVRTKSRGGNMSGAITAPKGTGDLAVDREITAALLKAKALNDGQSVSLPDHVASRAKRVVTKILSGDYPVEFKKAARELFSKLYEKGYRIVRSNAKLSTPPGISEYSVKTVAKRSNGTVVSDLTKNLSALSVRAQEQRNQVLAQPQRKPETYRPEADAKRSTKENAKQQVITAKDVTKVKKAGEK